MPRPSRRSAARRLLVGALLLGLTAVPFAGPASAARAPATPSFPAAIDAYAGSEPETSCSPTEKPGPRALRSLLAQTYPRISSNIVRPCSAGSSGHEEGRALDWMTSVRDSTQRDIAETMLSWLLATDQYGNPHANARRLGVMYVIWNNKMWRAYDPYRGGPTGWTEYSGCSAASKAGTGYDNACHRNHVHVSFSWDGANALTSWYGGDLTCPTPAAKPAWTGTATNLRAVAVQPFRALDTRKGASACRLAPKGRLDLRVTGVGGVPSTGVGAVVVNLTGTRADGGTRLSAYPAGTAWPGTSSVNVQRGSSAAALVVVPVGSQGSITIRNGGSNALDVVADVVGYYTTAAAGHGFRPVSPRRALDSRRNGGAPFGSGEVRTLQLAGRSGVPEDARGVLVNVTTTRQEAGGYVTAAPSITSRPATSTVNFRAGESVANRAMVALSPTGSIDLYASRPTHVVIDVVGWFGPSGSLRYTALQPSRVLDTRSGTGGLGQLVGGEPQRLEVGAGGAVPADARAVVGTLTMLRASRGSFATVWPSGSVPRTSDVNYRVGANRSNLVSTRLSAGGLNLTIRAGSAHANLDALGYYR
jgi:hypothetical protein